MAGIRAPMQGGERTFARSPPRGPSSSEWRAGDAALLVRRAVLLLLDEGTVLVGGHLVIAIGIDLGEHAAQRGMALGLLLVEAAVAVGVQVGPAQALAAGASPTTGSARWPKEASKKPNARP